MESFCNNNKPHRSPARCGWETRAARSRTTRSKARRHAPARQPPLRTARSLTTTPGRTPFLKRRCPTSSGARSRPPCPAGSTCRARCRTTRRARCHAARRRPQTKRARLLAVATVGSRSTTSSRAPSCSERLAPRPHLLAACSRNSARWALLCRACWPPRSRKAARRRCGLHARAPRSAADYRPPGSGARGRRLHSARRSP
mmetsp:Transcript_112917/g.326177  ORF Transcript_112917/g.326177 Transcript_112917/m.326177 type:complete len:201 (+) Transcript_112917:441-1043(+)